MVRENQNILNDFTIQMHWKWFYNINALQMILLYKYVVNDFSYHQNIWLLFCNLLKTILCFNIHFQENGIERQNVAKIKIFDKNKIHNLISFVCFFFFFFITKKRTVKKKNVAKKNFLKDYFKKQKIYCTKKPKRYSII